jgi:hypothetical protein
MTACEQKASRQKQPDASINAPAGNITMPAAGGSHTVRIALQLYVQRSCMLNACQVCTPV